MKILLVDDKDENRYLLEKVLQGKGYETLSAANGAEALDVAVKNPPDMIVTDILMPVMDGFTLCREWRKNKILNKIPFIFYTATYTDPKDEEFALSLGADRFIIKPQRMNDFIEIIKETLNTYKVKEAKVRHTTEEKVFLKEYNEALVRRLEEKMTRVEAIEKELREKNAVLERDIEERKKIDQELHESEKRLSSVIDTIGDIIYMLGVGKDGEYRFVLVNQMYLRTTGLPLEAIVGKRVRDVLPESSLSTVLDKYREAIQKKTIVRWEETTEYPAGEFIGEVSIAPLFDDDGTCTHLVGAVHDITERKRAEEELLRNETLMRTAVENLPLIFYIIDPDGKFRLSIGAGLQGLGLEPNQVVGQSVFDVYKNFPDITDSIKKSLAGKCVNFESYISGSSFANYISPFFIISGKIAGIVGVALDITERKRAEEELSALTLFQQAILAAVPDIIMEVDNNKVYNWANKAGMDFFGDDVIGKEASYYFEGDQATYNVVQPLFQGNEEIVYIESWQRRKDGEKRLLGWWCRVLKDKNGNVTGALSSARDITERKRSEEALAQEQYLMNILMDNVPDHIYFKDKESRFIRMNKSQATRFGLSDPAEALGKTDFDFFSEQHARPAFEDEQKIMKTGQPILGLEEKESWPDGSVSWVTTTKMPLRDKAGEVIGTFGISNEITQRKQAEESLRETHDYLENLLSFANAPIIVWDPDFKITRFNLAIEKLTGYTVYEVVGKHLEMLFPADSRASSLSFIAPASKGNHLRTVEIPILCKNGSTRTVLWSSANIYTVDGQTIVSTIAQGQDITEQKKLQRELIQSQKMESIGTLAGGIAHDFNNILGIILGYSTLIGRETLDKDKLHECLGIINNAIGRGAALVGQILTFARKTDVVFEPINVTELIRELLSMLRQTFPRVITFIDIVDKNIPSIKADRIQIHQVLMNLCVNARDAMPNGGTITIKAEKQTKIKVQERFSAADQDSYLCLSVTDTGEGMDEATRHQIFDPFFTTKEQGKGTGLGLAVVYGAVQSHNGYIDVVSEVGRGTTFQLYFPIPPASEQSSDDSLSTGSFTTGGTETILLVEDEEVLLEIVQLILESNGYTVHTAKDGNEAIKVYKQHQQEIDLVLTDMGLPGMTGLDLFKTVKKLNPKIKAIVASGFIEPNVKSELEKTGTKGLIQKPYSPDEVLRILREVLDAKSDEP